MGIRFAAARTLSALSTWSLKNIFHRPAANFPGKIALYIDPCVITHLRSRLQSGSVVVVGTNGKTTVTNLLADVLEHAGHRVVCNRTGANLDSGVATSLLHAKESDWGVFESDELWLAKILPHLQARYVVLLNLFRDQLDRVGEVDRIQESIAKALESSPETVLIYNADDPLCATIAKRVSNQSIAFGIAKSMGLPQERSADAVICQRCSSVFTYKFRQYDQLGDFSCPNCGFSRPALDFAVDKVNLASDGLSFSLASSLNAAQDGAANAADSAFVKASFSGAYMVYNLAAVATVARLLRCSCEVLQQAVDSFDPQNGRLQSFEVAGHRVLLNLAKNPTGFNQNLRIILQDEGPKAVAFYVNDKEGDGRDISWLWDINFEELAHSKDIQVFAGGMRKNDLQVRLKYAGLDAHLVDGAAEVIAGMGDLPADARVYMIANYTALPPVHEEINQLVNSQETIKSSSLSSEKSVACKTIEGTPEPPLVIAWILPELLNLQGDGGNVKILEQRLAWRGIPVEVRSIKRGDSLDLDDADLVFLGTGSDREQRLAFEELVSSRDALHDFVENDGVLLAICSGYQMLGHTWQVEGKLIEGLGLIDITAALAADTDERIVGDAAILPSCTEAPVIGYENHVSRTKLGEETQPFGSVVSSVGFGNNGKDGCDGATYRNVIGTYLHGPLLAKSPQLADELLTRALAHRAARTGCSTAKLQPLDDSIENEARNFMYKRLGISL